MGWLIAADVGIEHWVDVGRLPFWIAINKFFTFIGDARVITVVALSVAVIALRHRLWRYKLGFFFTLFGALGFTYALKLIVARPRPVPPYALMHVPGYSFPSMHAAVSLAVYGYVAYMLWRHLHPPHHRLPAVAVLAVLPFFIGFSRVYLGVHYASDVLGGWVVGAAFLWMGIWLTERYNRLI